MARASGLYAGVVTHARLKPRRHRLRYRIFMLLLDLDELPTLSRSLRLFGYERAAPFSFNEADHGDRVSVRAWIEGHLAQAGIAAGGPIRVLCMPRVLGGVFNPLSVWFCHRPDGSLAAILYEVRNTFGEQHSYLIPADPGPVVAQGCDKDFYVSPFMDMELTYGFRIAVPGERVSVGVDVHDADGLVLAAAFAGRRDELTDAGLLRAWLAHPLMTLGVMSAIHWEALKIWLKGERLRARPPAPERAVTVVRPRVEAAA